MKFISDLQIFFDASPINIILQLILKLNQGFQF